VTTRHLLILLAPRTDDATTQPTRLGIVASRKTGGAVQRNRAKRLLREVFRKNAGAFPPRVDVVVIVRPGTNDLSYGELEAEVLAVMPLIRKRAGGSVGSRSDARPPTRGRR